MKTHVSHRKIMRHIKRLRRHKELTKFIEAVSATRACSTFATVLRLLILEMPNESILPIIAATEPCYDEKEANQ